MELSQIVIAEGWITLLVALAGSMTAALVWVVRIIATLDGRISTVEVAIVAAAHEREETLFKGGQRRAGDPTHCSPTKNTM